MSDYSEQQRHQWLLLLGCALLVIGAGIGLRDPWPADEPRFALAARHMVETGNWLFPQRGNEFYSDKPPVFMWLQASVHALTGSWRLAFLLPSLLSGLLTLALIYDLAWRLHGRRVALIAAASLLFTLQFTIQTRAAQIDGVLVGMMTLAAYGLLRHQLLGPDWRWLWIGCFAAGIGTITKGVAFLALLIIPLAMLGRRLHWQGLQKQPVQLRNALIAALMFIGAICLWLLPMLYAVWRSADPALEAYARDILLGQTAARYLSAGHHQKPIWAYLEVILTLWLPTSIALIWAIPAWIKRWRRARRPARVLLPLAYVLALIAFFSLSSGKRGVYILPALPMLVLALAPMLPALLRRSAVQWSLFTAAALLALSLCCAALLALFANPAFAQRLDPLHGTGAWIVVLTMGLAGLFACAWMRPRRGAQAFAATLAGIWLLAGFALYPLITDSRSARAVMQQAGTMIGADAQLGLLSWKEQNLLMADRPATVFGFLRPRAEQELEAVAWLRAEPKRRHLLVQGMNLQACFVAEKARVVGSANRREWFLVDASALRDACLPHSPEAWERHRVAWH